MSNGILQVHDVNLESWHMVVYGRVESNVVPSAFPLKFGGKRPGNELGRLEVWSSRLRQLGKLLLTKLWLFFLCLFFSVNVPRISAALNASATPGSPTWLRCNVIYPAILTSPKTYWLFNNTRLPLEPQHYQAKEYGPRMGPNATTKLLPLELHISNVSAQDVGWYTCGADFKIDVVTANVFFSLKEVTIGGKTVDQGNWFFFFL